MLQFNEVLPNAGDIKGGVFCRKEKIGEQLFLYSFLDLQREQAEMASFSGRAKKNGEVDEKKLMKKRLSSGTIVFESNLDLPAAKVRLAFEDRWVLELIFDRYKNDLDFDATKVQSTSAVEGSEFVNFISVLITLPA